MKVYSLSGASGTGKSTSALSFAHLHNIDAIIDDGLLILHGVKIAGTSAKFEKRAVTAVKRAIFSDEAHCDEVKKAIVENNVQSLLIIGTSKKMTNHIAQRLDLGEIDYYYTIEDIRSNREIKMAQFVRAIQGKHVMPIPYRQVQQNFFKRIIQKGMDIVSTKKEKIGETTIVYPDFHQETIQISKSVYISLIKHAIQQCSVVRKLEQLQFSMDGQLPHVEAELTIAAPVTYDVIQKMTELQHAIDETFVTHFDIHTGEIILHLKGVESK